MVTSISLEENNTFGFQIHGYRSGHQLLYANTKLDKEDQDTIDRLSDISGSLRPGETFEPYFTCYPLPSNKYHVVARTWQDLHATRAGCVITKSLIIGHDRWASTQNIYIFFDALIKISLDLNLSVPNILVTEEQVPFVDSHLLDGLVEALFINKREPVVMFDCKEPVLTAIRILTVQWPTLRSKFAICTYSLSQRTINGKAFDLLFAPGSAKSKFSHWPGRFIEAGAPSKEQKMTRLITRSVFENKTPSLLQSNSSNFFPTELEMNEETFRLSLLWNDLITKLKSGQPFWAILGLLDVANVLPQKATVDLYNSIRKNIMEAVLIAPDSLPTEDSLNFIIGLLSRHKRKLMDREILHLVHRSVKKIAQKEVLKAIDFLQHYPNPISRIPSSVYAGIADGIAIPLRNIEESGFIQNLTVPEMGLQLISTSQEFAEIAVYYFEKNQTPWKSFLRMIFTVKDDFSKSRAARKVTMAISKNTSPELIDLLLSNSSEKTYKSVVNKFTLKNIVDNERFVTPIYLNASRLNLIDYLLDLLFITNNQTFAGSVIVNLLTQQPKFFNEFLLDERLNLNTAAHIINSIFTDPTEEFIGLLNNNKIISDFLINSAVSDHISKFATANILTYVNIPLEDSLCRLNKLPSDAINSINSYNLTTFLAKAMRELKTGFDDIFESLLSKIKKVNVNYLYEAAIHHNNSSERIIGNLEIILIDARFTNKLVENIDHISRLLEANLPGVTSTSILSSWSRTLSQSGKYKDLQKQAAVYMLQYAYRKAKKDPTELIAVSFPIVYKAFLKGKSITAAINQFLFPDWDKCKTLREELVEIYFKKNWSKFGLLSVAIAADILKEVLKIMSHKKNAKSIFDQALQEAIQSPKRNQILKAIAKLRD